MNMERIRAFFNDLPSADEIKKEIDLRRAEIAELKDIMRLVQSRDDRRWLGLPTDGLSRRPEKPKARAGDAA